MKKILLYILLILLILLVLDIVDVYSQSSGNNYINTRTYTSADGSHYLDKIQYFDGLGRPSQTVLRGITPLGQDLTTLQEYDKLGRESNLWLPAVMNKNTGEYCDPDMVKMNAINTNDDRNPYSLPVYEESPLNRIKEQYGAGMLWQENDKKVTTVYQTNVSDNNLLSCIYYKVGGNKQNPILINNGIYASGQLYVTDVKDEEGNSVYEFKNPLGQTILIRQMNGEQANDTYYVYDDFGKLSFVLPPRIEDEDIAVERLNGLAYQYKYDERNRCVGKKMPGCGWIHYVYDKADRLIYTQDDEQRNKNPEEWIFSVPDAFGRVVLTGICNDTISISNKTVKGVYSSTGVYKRYNIQVDGDNKTFVYMPSILSVSYYDNYDFRGMSEIPVSETMYIAETGYGECYGDHQATNSYKCKGLLTGTLTAQMNNDGVLSSAYLYSVMYYDNRGRVVQTQSNNHIEGGLEKEYTAYNFAGQPVRRKHVHSATGKTTLTEIYAYTYDHAGRLLKITHQLTNGTIVMPQVVLTENVYDELGRLKNKSLGINSH